MGKQQGIKVTNYFCTFSDTQLVAAISTQLYIYIAISLAVVPCLPFLDIKS